MRFAYVDPPYLGCCALYGHVHVEPYGCWDDIDTHGDLIDDLTDQYPEGWALSASSSSLWSILPACPNNVRVAAWVKPFCAFKRGVRLLLPEVHLDARTLASPARRQEPMDAERRMVNVISIDVECPWCGARPGEPCTEGDGQGGIRPASVMNLRGHIARTKEVPAADHHNRAPRTQPSCGPEPVDDTPDEAQQRAVRDG